LRLLLRLLLLLRLRLRRLRLLLRLRLRRRRLRLLLLLLLGCARTLGRILQFVLTGRQHQSPLASHVTHWWTGLWCWHGRGSAC
jgi:hypothetical protein